MQGLNKFIFLSLLAISFACARKSSCQAYDNGKEPRVFTYAPKNTYSRALAAKGNKLFIGNSDGLIYKLNVRNGKSKAMSKQALPELRDIAVTGCTKVIAMQSADTSAMIALKGKKATIFPVSKVPVFLDGMDILPSGTGFLMGDPVDGYFSLYKTKDAGKTWEEIQPKLKAENGEAGFAASGSNVQCLNDSTFIFVSGGMRSRFFKTTNAGKTWTATDLPFKKSEASGPFSVHFMNEREGVAVGGDYTKPESNEKTSFYTKDGGITWTESSIPALGYRSCVIALDDYLLACGTNGIDKSEDGGITWGRYWGGNYIALIVVKNRIYATMPEGKIIEL